MCGAFCCAVSLCISCGETNQWQGPYQGEIRCASLDDPRWFVGTDPGPRLDGVVVHFRACEMPIGRGDLYVNARSQSDECTVDCSIWDGERYFEKVPVSQARLSCDNFPSDGTDTETVIQFVESACNVTVVVVN